MSQPPKTSRREDERATPRLLFPQVTVEERSNPDFRVGVGLANIEPHCDSNEEGLSMPCAGGIASSYPKLFYCVWAGDHGSAVVGPLHAESTEVTMRWTLPRSPLPNPRPTFPAASRPVTLQPHHNPTR